MYTYSFEKLEVWQLSRNLVRDTYLLTSNFEAGERDALVDRIRESSISVSCNLAKSAVYKTPKEQSTCTLDAYRDLMALLNQLILSVDLGFVEEENFRTIRPRIEELANKLNAFRNSQLQAKKGASQGKR